MEHVVLTVAKVTGRVAGGYAEYLQAKTHGPEVGDYYQHDGGRVEAPGRWVCGHDTVAMDGNRPVTGEQLADLMAVRYPGTDRPLRPAGGSGEAVSAIDATFSAPKSVSAVWAIADLDLRAQIEHAHEAAVDGAVAYSLEHLNMVRRRVGRRSIIHEPAIDLVATSWRHTTARAVDGRLPDPQLHSHVLLHAAVRVDGQVAAIDSRSWFVHRREVGSAYRTHLAHHLAQLGFQIERGTGRGGRYFEIAGIPQVLLDRWSGRAREIEQEITDRIRRQNRPDRWTGKLSPAEDRRVRVATRSGKQQHSAGDLGREWNTTAAEAGVSTGTLAELRSAGPQPVLPLQRAQLISALTEFDATFTDREMRAVALEQSAGTLPNVALTALAAAQDEHEILTLQDGKFTTRLHRGTERHVLTVTDAALADEAAAISPDAVAVARDEVDRRLAHFGGQLSVEQNAALEAATGARQVVMIEGQAGTGKSTVMQAVALAHHHDGQQIIVTSTAALAAQRLTHDLQQIGAPADSYSTTALTHAIRTEQLHLGPGVTVIHDEAALASTREQRQLHEAIEQSGARLILVGDPQQSQPVGAGGLWPHIEHASQRADAQVTLTENLRARDPADRDAQHQFREKHYEHAIENYAARGHVHLTDRARDAEIAALTDAHQDRRNGHDTLVIAQTSNDHLDELNAAAQTLRLADRELGTDAIPVTGRPYSLHAGDQIQIRRTLQTDDAGAVRNGTTGVVDQIDAHAGRAQIRLGDDRRLELSAEQLVAADVRLSYVQHPFPAQGLTSDRTHLIVAEHATRHGTYVALTRARDRTTIHAANDHLNAEIGDNATQRLAATVSREETGMPSIAFQLARHTDHTDSFTERLAAKLRAQPAAASRDDPAHGIGQGYEL